MLGKIFRHCLGQKPERVSVEIDGRDPSLRDGGTGIPWLRCHRPICKPHMVAMSFRECISSEAAGIAGRPQYRDVSRAARKRLQLESRAVSSAVAAAPAPLLRETGEAPRLRSPFVSTRTQERSATL